MKPSLGVQAAAQREGVAFPAGQRADQGRALEQQLASQLQVRLLRQAQVAGEEVFEHLAQCRAIQLAAFQLLQRQVQAGHMDAACVGVVQAHGGAGSPRQWLAGQAQGQGDPLHADPVQCLLRGSAVQGDIRQGEGVHRQSVGGGWNLMLCYNK